MNKKVTVHDIAKKLNISISTVSRALNDSPRISEDMKQLVREAADELSYRVNGVASALRMGRTRTMGVILPTADRSFFSGVIRGIEDMASEHAYNVMICQSNDSYQAELKDIAALLRAQVDGILMSNARETLDFKHLDGLIKQRIPVVLFDRVVYKPGISTVTVDDYRGAYRATEHLIEQGYERIAAFTLTQQHLNIYKERLRGHKEALEAHGRPVLQEYIHFNDLRIEGGRAGAAHFHALPTPPDAIFCTSDYAALGAMQYYKSLGLRIPQDIGLVGFANEPLSSYIEPALTSVDQRPVEMGRAAAQLFLEQMDAEANPIADKHIVLNADLVIRQSSLRTG